MLRKRLKALGFLEWEKVQTDDPQHIRKVVVWLEDQKIRHYKITERSRLRDTCHEDWSDVFEQYCADVGCSVDGNQLDKLEWLLGYALWLEFADNPGKYESAVDWKLKKKKDAAQPKIKSSNPLDDLDFDSDEFRAGVKNIGRLLRVPLHPDHLITLAATSKLVNNRLKSASKKQQTNDSTGNTNTGGRTGRTGGGGGFSAMDVAPGFNLKDSVLENAAKGLALLYIQDLRDLQTEINEAIVAAQTVTANPRTDTKLGKVGK